MEVSSAELRRGVGLTESYLESFLEVGATYGYQRGALLPTIITMASIFQLPVRRWRD